MGKRSRKNFFRGQVEGHKRILADQEHTYDWKDEQFDSDIIREDHGGRFALVPANDGDKVAEGHAVDLTKVASSNENGREEWYDAKTKTMFTRDGDSSTYRAKKLSRQEAKDLEADGT
jgi:hypothetical protein